MDRKQFLTIFTFIFLTTPLAWSENQVLQDSVDDMSIQKESDQMDVYDQQQIVEQTKKETNELQKQSKQLERDIEKLARESKALSEMINKRGQSYQSAVEVYKKLNVSVRQSEGKRNQLKTQVDALNKKLTAMNTKLRDAKIKNAKLSQEVRAHERNKKRLEGRKNNLDAKLNKVKEDNDRLRKESKS